MPRIARVVGVGYPHHVTQRGNNQQRVFRGQRDYKTYLSLLEEYCSRFGLDVWAYCLMPNHAHLVVVPRNNEAMSEVFHAVHTCYSQYFNFKNKRKGHVWQSRFYSCILDEAHLFAAIRYVERNPVRAGFVKNALDYEWSSARAHSKKEFHRLLRADCYLVDEIPDWEKFLSEPDSPEKIKTLRERTLKGYPAGDDAFVKRISSLLGHKIIIHSKGRPTKVNNNP